MLYVYNNDNKKGKKKVSSSPPLSPLLRFGCWGGAKGQLNMI